MLKFLKKPNGLLYVLTGIAVSIVFFLSSCSYNSNNEIKNYTTAETPWYGWNKYQIKPEDSLVRLGTILLKIHLITLAPRVK